MDNHLKFHPIHPFPARMAPSIALDELPEAGDVPLRVLDPMAGSGTTLIAARMRGHVAFGFDTDPLALLLSQTWCSTTQADRIRKLAHSVLADAKNRYLNMKIRDAYPLNADEETRSFVRYWFDPTNRRQLAALSISIGNVRKGTARNVLWSAFSRLIIAKARGASRAMDLSHSRPHRVLTKTVFRPLPQFLSAVETVLKHMPFNSEEKSTPPATIQRGDARAIALPDKSIDIVITSPPYLNAIDYIRCSKFSLIWMGHQIPSLRKLRSINIGSETIKNIDEDDEAYRGVLVAMGNVGSLSVKNRRILSRYVCDMDSVLAEISRVLVPGGRCILVIGDSTIRGVFIKNSAALIKLAERYGMSSVNIKSRPLPANRRYLPPPTPNKSSSDMGNRMREEIVITLQAA